MDLQRYRHFVAVAEELHFSRAAARLSISQPQLSQSIKRLERAIGVQLIERTHNFVALTPAGHGFLEEARRCLMYADRAERTALMIASGELARLRIGFTTHILPDVLSGAIQVFREQNPDIELRLEEGESAGQLHHLKDGHLDLALVDLTSCSPAPGMEVRRLRRYKYVAAIPDRWPEAGRSKVQLADLASRKFILLPYRRTPEMHQTIVAACKAAGFIPNVIQEAQRSHTIMNLVACGLGVSLLPEIAASYGTAGVKLKPLDDLPDSVCADLAMVHVPPVSLKAQQLLMDAILASAANGASAKAVQRRGAPRRARPSGKP